MTEINPEGDMITGKPAIWISALVVGISAFLGDDGAQAAVRKTNSLSNVSTHIIPNWNNSGSDVCVVQNANSVSVSVLVSVFPTETLVLAGDRWTLTMVLGAYSGARVFTWTPLLPASEYCKVMVVR
jgi:hypothetical protein